MTQVQALKQAKKLFGTSAFTEHHINYFRVGYWYGAHPRKLLVAIGDSWEEALTTLDSQRKDMVNHDTSDNGRNKVYTPGDTKRPTEAYV
jgi:hypothetical protein